MVLALGLALAAVLSAALYFGNRFWTSPEPKDPDQETSRLQAEVASLRTAINRLSRRPPAARTAESVASSASAVPTEDDARINGGGLTLGDVLADVPADKQEDFLEQLGNKENIARKERTLAQLASEPRDPTWEADVRTTIAEAEKALDRDAFPTTRISSIDCGNTVCKIEVDQDSASEHASFAGVLQTGMRTFGVKRGGKGNPLGERQGWTLFVARDGHRLPKVELEELLSMETPPNN